jgi:hypothetical protein
LSYIGTKPANAALTASDIADDIISLAKMSSGTDGNLITYDASGNPAAVATGTSGHFLKSQGAGSVPVFAAAGGGITQASQFRLSANTNSATNADITANIELIDDESSGRLGTGVSQSSGIFSFGETGHYLVIFFATMTVGAYDQTIVTTNVTLDDSSYDAVAEAHCMGSSAVDFAGITTTSYNLVDVTDTSNVKVKFTTSSFGSASVLEGNTALNKTSFTFIRLGDT